MTRKPEPPGKGPARSGAGRPEQREKPDSRSRTVRESIADEPTEIAETTMTNPAAFDPRLAALESAETDPNVEAARFTEGMDDSAETPARIFPPPGTDTPELQVLEVHLEAEELRRLNSALSGADEDHDLRRASGSPKRCLQRLMHSGSYQDLKPRERAFLLKSIAEDPKAVSVTNAARTLVESGVFEDVPDRTRQALLRVFRKLPSDLRTEFGALSARNVGAQPALLFASWEGETVLEHIEGILNAELAPAFKAANIAPHQVLTAVLQALVQPAAHPVEEGADGVLGVMEFSLALASPGEFIRLWRRLSTERTMVTLPSQERLDLTETLRRPNALSGHDTPLRLGLEQLAGLAHARKGPHRSAFIRTGGQSLDADVVARALGLLFGVGYTVAAGASSALRQLKRLAGNGERSPPAFVSLLDGATERLYVFDRLTRDKLHIRTPRGASTKPVGATRKRPARTVELPSLGVDNMERATAEPMLGVALVPRLSGDD